MTANIVHPGRAPGRLPVMGAARFAGYEDPDVAPSGYYGLDARPPWTLRRGQQNLLWLYVTGLCFLIFFVSALFDGESSRVQHIAGMLLLTILSAYYVTTAWMVDTSLRTRWLYVGGCVALMASMTTVWGWEAANLGAYLSVMIAALVPWRQARFAVPAAGLLLIGAGVVSRDPTTFFIAAIATGVGWAMGAGIEGGRVGQQLAQAERRVSVLSVAAERERIGRDLHDLLGHSLTTISIKSELAARLIDHDRQAARTELTEVAEIAHQALTDVRATTSGFRKVRVSTELTSARSVLLAAGIEADCPTSVDPLTDELSELFGYVIREAVTNVVRHSGARNCTITLNASEVRIIDDGQGFMPERRGCGLVGLLERVDARGATMSITSVVGSGTTLTAQLIADLPASTPRARAGRT